MKLRIFSLIIMAAAIIYSCKTPQKTVVNSVPEKKEEKTVPENTVAANNNSTGANMMLPLDIYYAPGGLELTTIQRTYPTITSDTLKLGHQIFFGPCTKCHVAYGFFNRSESSWKHEVKVMSIKANITTEEKNALWKYILAMRAAYPNGK